MFEVTDNFVNISFRNDGQYNDNCVNIPITKNGNVIGVIRSVSDKVVEGIILNRYIVPEIRWSDKKIVSVEICKN